MNLGRKCDFMKEISDFSEINELDDFSKQELLRCLKGECPLKELSESVAAIATIIFIKRLMYPGFIPEQLKNCKA